MSRISGFAPIADTNAQILILGSMPSAASLCANQYYAHPRNAFWKIMAQILGFNAEDTYDIRQQALMHAGIALWDVLQSCVRPGSLDTSIDTDSIQTNDFATFYRDHTYIKLVCFNGATAERYYNKLVSPTLPLSSKSYRRLPSTSPAHAALSVDKKTLIWRAVLEPQ